MGEDKALKEVDVELPVSSHRLKKSILGIAISVLLMACSVCFLPDDGTLTFQGRAAIGMVAAMIVLAITEAVPFSVIGVALMLGMYFFGIYSFEDTWVGFGTYAIFFTMAMFALCGAIMKTNLPQRVIGHVLKWAGSSPKKLIAGLMSATAICSMFMSNFASCILFLGIGLGLMKACSNGFKNLGRALFIAIPSASVVGGMAAMSGEVLNVMAVGAVEQFTGYTITFLQWSIVGLPVAVVMIAFLSWWTCFVFKPEPIPKDLSRQLVSEYSKFGKFSLIEKKTTVILLVMIACWVAGNWISILNPIVVACVGMVVLFLPGINLLNGKEFCDCVNWDVLIFLGCVMAFMTGFSDSGAATWIVSKAVEGASGLTPTTVLFLIAIIAAVGHVIVPSGPAVFALLAVTLITLGQNLGIDPMVVGFIVALFSQAEFLLPFDGIYLLSYGYGNFKFADMLKWGWAPTILLLLLTVFLVPPLASLI